MGQTGTAAEARSGPIVYDSGEIGVSMNGLRVVREMRRGILYAAVVALILGCAGQWSAWAQLPMPGEQATPNSLPNPLMDPTAKPGKVLLFDFHFRMFHILHENIAHDAPVISLSHATVRYAF